MPDSTPTSGAKPGILHVLSTTLNPSALSPRAFATWYENTHIQEVQSTGGISSTARYESLTFASAFRNKTFPVLEKGNGVPRNRGQDYEFLTVYQMPDLAFRESEAFRGLDGQRKPRKELLEGLFRHVEFRTCFAEEVSTTAGKPAPGAEAAESEPAPFIVTTSSSAGQPAGPDLSTFPDCRRVTRYEVKEGSELRAFERSALSSEHSEITIAEFDNEGGVEAVVSALGKEPPEGLEVGFWGLRRAYEGSERTPAEWEPPPTPAV